MQQAEPRGKTAPLLERVSTVRKPMRESLFLNAVGAIQARSTRFALVGVAFYVMLTAALLVAAVTLHNTVQTAERTLVLTLPRPLAAPMLIGGMVAAVYLAVAAAAALARERERGTLEVLLFGPVNESAALLGIFTAYLRLALLAILGILVWTLAAALILHLAIAFVEAWLILLLILAASLLIAMGLVAASFGTRARTAIASFLVIIVALAAIQVGDQIVARALASGRSSDSLIVINKILGMVIGVIRWVSPFALVMDGSEYLASGQMALFLTVCLVLISFTLVCIGSAAAVLRAKRGAA